MRLSFDHDSPENLGKAGLNSLLSRVSPGFASFVMNLLIGRLGSPALLGATQTVISTASVATLIYPAPAGEALTKHVAVLNAAGKRDEAISLAQYVLHRVLAVSLLTSLLLGGAAVLWWGSSVSVAVLTGLMIFSVSLRAYTEALHFGLGRTGRLAKAAFAVALVSTLGTLALLLAGVRSAWVLIPLIAAHLVFAIVSWPPRVRGRLSREFRREIAGFVLIACVGTMASTGFQQIGVILATWANGTEYTGNLAAALALIAPLLLLSTALATVLFPAMAVAHNARDLTSLRHRVDVSTRLISLVIVAGALVLIILAPQIIALVWGDRYESAAWMMQLLVVAVCATAIGSPSVSFITSESNRGMMVSSTISVGGALVGLGVWAALIPIDSVLAIPLGLMIAAIVIGGVAYGLVWRRLGLNWLIQTGFVVAFLIAAHLLSSSLAALEADAWNVTGVAAAAVCGWALVRWNDMRDLIGRTRVLLSRG